MWFLSEDNYEFLRSGPLLLAMSVLCLGVVTAKHDFPVYRMQHFDLHGAHFGSRSAAVNMEVRGVGVSMVNRKCVMVKWAWLNPNRFLELVHKGAGAVLILLPQDWKVAAETAVTVVKSESDEIVIVDEEEEEETLKYSWMEVEEKLLALDVPIPVYFAIETPELSDIHDKVADGGDSESAAAALLASVAGEGYQVVADASDPKPLDHHEVVSFVGKLGGAGNDQNLPTVAIVTHYDTFGLAPGLSTGPDSNGSGVAAMLELARLFSLLYSDPHTKPSYNLLLVLTGGGHLGYFGTKYFIEDMLEDDESFLLTKADYVLCLDSIAASNSSDLFVHLSRPPSNNTGAYQLLQHVNQSSMLFPSTHMHINHKKVRIGAGEELVAWEHERFSLRRIPAATVSRMSLHTDPRRKAMFSQTASPQSVVTTVRVLAEGIARHMIGLPYQDDNITTPIFSGSLAVKEDYISAWLSLLSTIPRSPQLLEKDHPLLTSLEETLSKYVDEVTKFSHSADKNDPEFVLYSVPSTTMHLYSVKPAIFDLFLALTIAGYAGLVYLLVGHFTEVLQLLAPILLKIKSE